MSDKLRLEYLRGEIKKEQISTGELIELQGLADQIDPSDVLLLEWAGVPEFDETTGTNQYHGAAEAYPRATLDQLRGAIHYLSDNWGDYGYRLTYGGSDLFVASHSDDSVFTFLIDFYGNHYVNDGRQQ